MKKIKLNFMINLYDETAYECQNDVLKPFYIQYNYTNMFDEDITLKEVIDFILNRLKSNNYYIHLNQLWKYYFNDDIIYKININETINCKLYLLEEQFEITNSIIPIDINPFGIGDSVGNLNGIKFFFHTNEKDIHNKPHIHCRYSDEEFRIDLNDLQIMDKPFKNKSKTKLALNCIKKNKESLINYWNKVVVKGEKVKFKMYL